MSLEELFIKGCYYYAANNPIWYVYRANLSKRQDVLTKRVAAFQKAA